MKKYCTVIHEKPWIGYLLVVLVGIALRLIQIGSKSLWVDEAYASGLMGMNPVDLVKMSVAGSPHPPLAFLFLRVSTLVFGQSEAGMRMVPALASALAAIPLMCFIARKIELKAALWAGIIWSVAPFSVSLGQEVWLYGVISLFGFLFIDVADRAWNGCRRALYYLVPLALIGMLIQHFFALYIAAGFALYFTVPKEQRLPLKYLIIASVVFLVLYSPFSLLLFKQAVSRAERMTRAAMDMAAVYKYRFIVRIPTVFTRLIPGGLLLEAGREIISDKKQIVFWLLFGATNVILLLNLFLRNFLDKKFRIWLLLVFTVPFLIFLKEDPTVRHLSILWIPLGFAIASASHRWKFAGPVLLLLTGIMLLPYYNITSFPYHRSDWRGAAGFVEERLRDDEGILVLGAQSGGLAWDYYSSEDRVAFNGEDPYSMRLASERSMQSVVDSLLNLHESIWIVNDYWGGPRTAETLTGCRILSETWISPAMEVLHISGR
jgi:uncharacterized membrane protein